MLGVLVEGGTVTDVPTPHERPRYRAVAAELRRRIAAGVIPPGALLPPEAALMDEFGVSRGTIREALGLLRVEGLILTARGRGTQVRPVLPVRRLAADRYRRELERARNPGAEPGTSFTADQGIGWRDYQLDKEFREAPASPAWAELLQVEPGTPLLERRFVFRAHGTPEQMSTSCYPLELVAGTGITDPANEPWPGGNIAQLATLGVWVTQVRELVRARMPMPDEAETLQIPTGVPVLAITRVMMAGARPVEAADIVRPADRAELAYEIDLSD